MSFHDTRTTSSARCQELSKLRETSRHSRKSPSQSEKSHVQSLSRDNGIARSPPAFRSKNSNNEHAQMAISQTKTANSQTKFLQVPKDNVKTVTYSPNSLTPQDPSCGNDIIPIEELQAIHDDLIDYLVSQLTDECFERKNKSIRKILHDISVGFKNRLRPLMKKMLMSIMYEKDSDKTEQRSFFRNLSREELARIEPYDMVRYLQKMPFFWTFIESLKNDLQMAIEKTVQTQSNSSKSMESESILETMWEDEKGATMSLLVSIPKKFNAHKMDLEDILRILDDFSADVIAGCDVWSDILEILGSQLLCGKLLLSTSQAYATLSSGVVQDNLFYGILTMISRFIIKIPNRFIEIFTFLHNAIFSYKSEEIPLPLAMTVLQSLANVESFYPVLNTKQHHYVCDRLCDLLSAEYCFSDAENPLSVLPKVPLALSLCENGFESSFWLQEWLSSYYQKYLISVLLNRKIILHWCTVIKVIPRFLTLLVAKAPTKKQLLTAKYALQCVAHFGAICFRKEGKKAVGRSMYKKTSKALLKVLYLSAQNIFVCKTNFRSATVFLEFFRTCGFVMSELFSLSIQSETDNDEIWTSREEAKMFKAIETLLDEFQLKIIVSVYRQLNITDGYSPISVSPHLNRVHSKSESHSQRSPKSNQNSQPIAINKICCSLNISSPSLLFNEHESSTQVESNFHANFIINLFRILSRVVACALSCGVGLTHKMDKLILNLLYFINFHSSLQTEYIEREKAFSLDDYRTPTHTLLISSPKTPVSSPRLSPLIYNFSDDSSAECSTFSWAHRRLLQLAESGLCVPSICKAVSRKRLFNRQFAVSVMFAICSNKFGAYTIAHHRNKLNEVLDEVVEQLACEKTEAWKIAENISLARVGLQTFIDRVVPSLWIGITKWQKVGACQWCSVPCKHMPSTRATQIDAHLHNLSNFFVYYRSAFCKVTLLFGNSNVSGSLGALVWETVHWAKNYSAYFSFSASFMLYCASFVMPYLVIGRKEKGNLRNLTKVFDEENKVITENTLYSKYIASLHYQSGYPHTYVERRFSYFSQLLNMIAEAKVNLNGNFFSYNLSENLLMFVDERPSLKQLHTITHALIFTLLNKFVTDKSIAPLSKSFTPQEKAAASIAWETKTLLFDKSVYLEPVGISEQVFADELCTLMRVGRGDVKVPLNDEATGDWFVVTVYLILECSYSQSFAFLKGLLSIKNYEMRKKLSYLWPALLEKSDLTICEEFDSFAKRALKNYMKNPTPAYCSPQLVLTFISQCGWCFGGFRGVFEFVISMLLKPSIDTVIQFCDALCRGRFFYELLFSNNKPETYLTSLEFNED